jgi:hypothetical protein
MFVVEHHIECLMEFDVLKAIANLWLPQLKIPVPILWIVPRCAYLTCTYIGNIRCIGRLHQDMVETEDKQMHVTWYIIWDIYILEVVMKISKCLVIVQFNRLASMTRYHANLCGTGQCLLFSRGK